MVSGRVDPIVRIRRLSCLDESRDFASKTSLGNMSSSSWIANKCRPVTHVYCMYIHGIAALGTNQ